MVLKTTIATQEEGRSSWLLPPNPHEKLSLECLIEQRSLEDDPVEEISVLDNKYAPELSVEGA